MTTSAVQIVVSDANVLINLIHVAQLDLCARIPGYQFLVPDRVVDEITIPDQRTVLDHAIARAVLRIESIVELPSLALFAELRSYLGRGESACLAIAIANGWIVASDEKRRFRREAEARVGPSRILGTADIFVLAIRNAAIDVDHADRCKATLERLRFKMPFRSFRELVQS